MFSRASLLLVASLLPAIAGAQRAAVGPDSARLARAQQLAAGGSGAAARAIVDSVLAERAPTSPEYAEALYWSGLLAASAADAEMTYRRLVVEHTTSSRAPDALLRLAQLEAARGDRPAALGHLGRLARDYRAGSADARAGLWAARFLFDEGDPPTACGILALARAGAPTSDVELTNQVDYQLQRCAGVEPAAADAGRVAPPAGTRPEAADTVGASATSARADGTRAERPAALARGADGYSAQIAAYRSRPEAEATARRLARRGYPARVVGEAAPFRVRVGRYVTRAGAVEMQRTLKRAKIDAIVVEAEPRRPAPRPARP